MLLQWVFSGSNQSLSKCHRRDLLIISLTSTLSNQFKLLIVANDGVSISQETYIQNVVNIVHHIDRIMDLVESKQPAEKAAGMSITCYLRNPLIPGLRDRRINDILDLVISNCRNKIERRIHGFQARKFKWLQGLTTYLQTRHPVVPFDANLSYTPPGHIRLPP